MALWRIIFSWCLTGLLIIIRPVGAFLLLCNTRSSYERCCSGRSDGCHGDPTTKQIGISTPEQLRRHVSFEKWLQLPESWASAQQKKTTNTSSQQSSSSSLKVAYQKHIRTLHADHPIKLGVTRKRRSAEFLNAAEQGNSTRLDILLRAGVDVDAMDIYRITSLHYAACHGHIEVVRMLLLWGASICSSSLSAASANGHGGIFDMLNTIPTVTHFFNDTAVQLQLLFERDQLPFQVQTTSVIPLSIDHVGAGSSFYIDNAFCVEFIEKLVNLHGSLRKIGGATMQSTNAARRSHFCDTEGWLCTALANALQYQSPTRNKSSQTSSPSSPIILQHVFSHVRFISYLGEDDTTSFLAPHIDHPVLDRSSGRMSTHTFILYLTTVETGGETVLLDHLPANNHQNNSSRLCDDSIVQYGVKPVRGRLFVFPHSCPHAGRKVVEGSKLILRGDMC